VPVDLQLKDRVDTVDAANMRPDGSLNYVKRTTVRPCPDRPAAKTTEHAVARDSERDGVTPLHPATALLAQQVSAFDQRTTQAHDDLRTTVARAKKVMIFRSTRTMRDTMKTAPRATAIRQGEIVRGRK
jgi:hypothetical protein